MVLPVADLDVARGRLTDLGFTVAPEAGHPFGTANACVYFADDTFLEPLAVAERETCEEEARAGNAFVARDMAFRFRNGEDGFSALVFASGDAAADDAAFRRAGIGGGAELEFARIFSGPSGERAEAAFHLAFAADLRSPDVFFFTCERVRSPGIDRSPLERHPNGVTGIAEVILVEENPSDFQYLLQELVGERRVHSTSFGIALAAANGRVTVLTPEGMSVFFGDRQMPAGRGLRLAGLVFRVDALGALERRMGSQGVRFERRANRVVVPEAPGQGAIFAFEEKA